MKHLILTICLVLAGGILSPLRADQEDLRLAYEQLAGGDVSRATSSYHYGVLFTYVTNTSPWGTGLAVTNHSSGGINVMVGVWNQAGAVVGRGYLTLAGFNQAVNMLSAFMSEGSVPPRGHLAVFGTGSFSADKYIFNDRGGYGEIDREGEYFQ